MAPARMIKPHHGLGAELSEAPARGPGPRHVFHVLTYNHTFNCNF
jgi:hypothetical protein